MKIKRSNHNLKVKMYFFSVVAAIVLVVSLVMYQRFKIDLIMKDIHKLEERKKQLISETELLRTEVDLLRNIDRISTYARNNLQMMQNTDQISVFKIENYDELEELRSKFAQKDQEIQKVKMAGVQ